jgi:ribose transport system substrate-binding protein
MKTTRQLWTASAMAMVVVLLMACAAPAPTAPTQPPAPAAITEIKAAADGSYPGLYELTPDGSAKMAPYKPSKPYKIGLSNIGNQFPFVVAMNAGMDQAVKDMGLNLIFTDAQGDAQKQIAQMEDITTQKPAGTVLVALDANAVIPQLEASVKQGVPVLTCWNDLGGPPRQNWPGSISLVGVDEVETGRKVGRETLKLLPNGGKVAIIEGAAGFQASIERSEGFKEVLAQNPKIEIVASQPGNWTREGALSVAENFIQAHPDLNVIYAHDDNMALGAVSALKNANLLDKVKVVGIGGSKEGLESIKNGELHSTVYDSPMADTYVCIKALVMSLDGVKLPSEIWLPRPVVTKDNVDQFKGEW